MMNSNPDRWLLIVNPISGTSNKRGLEKIVRDKMAPLGVTIEQAWTTSKGDATRLARKAVAEGYGSVIAAGGDGTVNETATALLDTGVTLGIIPCGSGNGLARHLEIPVDVDESLEIIALRHVTRCDSGRVNDLPFFCTFGLGFDATVSEKFAQEKHRGKLTYVKNTCREFLNYHSEEYTITANGQKLTEKAFLVAVCNASQYGNNAYIAPDASMTDGMLDITIVHDGNLLSTALVGVDLMTGNINNNTQITRLRAATATISRSAPGPAHIDGEPVTMAEKMDIMCLGNSLHVYTPLELHTVRPIITPLQAMAKDFSLWIKKLGGHI